MWQQKFVFIPQFLSARPPESSLKVVSFLEYVVTFRFINVLLNHCTWKSISDQAAYILHIYLYMERKLTKRLWVTHVQRNEARCSPINISNAPTIVSCVLNWESPAIDYSINRLDPELSNRLLAYRLICVVNMGSLSLPVLRVLCYG
jgi:hypothetical protein